MAEKNVKNWLEFLKDIPTKELSDELERRKVINSIDSLNPLTIKIMGEINSALRRFGKYSFEDKGPEEVMNVQPIATELKTKSLEEVAEILKEVLDNYDKFSKVGDKSHAKSMVDCLIHSLDDMDWFDDLFEFDERFEY
jgi:hypothetical protein